MLRKKKLAADRKVAFNKTLGLLDVIAIGIHMKCSRAKQQQQQKFVILKYLFSFNIYIKGLSCSLNGIYVIIGHSIKFETGPSIIVSFVIAAFSILLSGSSHATFSFQTKPVY